MTSGVQPLALALSSSTGVMSAAVGRVGTTDPLAATTLATDRRHAEEISPMIQKLLADGGVALGDIEVFVVDRGPGRFTGLRVGLATVKTLAFATGAGVVALTSLEILAAVARSRFDDDVRHGADEISRFPVTAVIDARRNEVFQQLFGSDGKPLGDPQVGPATTLAAEAVGLVVGDGLDRYRADYEAAAATAQSRLIDGVDVDASVMLTVAAGRPVSPGSRVEPLYLRDPDVNPSVKTRPRA